MRVVNCGSKLSPNVLCPLNFRAFFLITLRLKNAKLRNLFIRLRLRREYFFLYIYIFRMEWRTAAKLYEKEAQFPQLILANRRKQCVLGIFIWTEFNPRTSKGTQMDPPPHLGFSGLKFEAFWQSNEPFSNCSLIMSTSFDVN